MIAPTNLQRYLFLFLLAYGSSFFSFAMLPSPSFHRLSIFPKPCRSVLSLCFIAVVFTLGLGILSLQPPSANDFSAHLLTGILRTHFASVRSSSRFCSDPRPKISGKPEGTRTLDARTVKDEVFRRIDTPAFDGKPLQSDSIVSTSSDGDSSKQHTGRAKNATSLAILPPGHCNLFEGKWVADSQETLYKNYSCPILSQLQNCQGNGRPDRGYERWRWKPNDCSLPRFDVQDFFRIMKGKTLGFVGDSVARNHMESLMCILWQVEVPQNRGFRRMQRWFFPVHSVTIVRIWSSWLVHLSYEEFGIVPENITKLHLEVPDENLMDFLPRIDVLVVSSGHWFSKQAAYISKGEVVGAQLWTDKRFRKKLDIADAFGITIRTALSAITSHPGYNGLTILRTYSPDHYEGGAWNAGGSCTDKTEPLKNGEVALNGYSSLMRRQQLEAFAEMEHANVSNGSKLRLMDITGAFEYRADGHPGPYRNTDPNKITKRGPRGKPPPQDCLHWCMPGPIDTWNEFLLEILRQQFSYST